jgi:hypothetical protein
VELGHQHGRSRVLEGPARDIYPSRILYRIARIGGRKLAVVVSELGVERRDAGKVFRGRDAYDGTIRLSRPVDQLGVGVGWT